MCVAARDRIALNVNGTWYRREAGQSEDDALRFFKRRAFRTGKDLNDVQLGDPTKVGSTGLAVTPPVIPTLFPLTNGETHSSGGTAKVHVTGDESTYVTVITETDLGDEELEALPAPVIRRSLGAKSGVNLLGELEKWAFADAQKVTQASLTMNGISIKDLRDLCIKLPPKLLVELQIILPPEGGKP
jgi:hypothetical protein